MARLKKGTKPTPVRERLEKYRRALIESGGRRVIVDLEQPATEALEHIMRRDELSIKAAVHDALLFFARSKKKPPLIAEPGANARESSS